jgi:hypothetical protein
MNRAIRTEKLDPSEILRVRPIPGKLNSFKISFDKKAIDLQKKLKNLAATNQRIPKELLEQKQAFEELGTQVFGKQYSIGKIGPSGKVIDWGAPKFGEEKLTTQAKKGLRLFERIQNIARNLPDNPDLQKLFQAAKIGTKGITAFGQLRKFNPDAAIKFINELLIKNPGLRVELLGDEYADIKNYYADLGTTMTDAGMDIDFSLPPEKVPTETLPGIAALATKYGKKALSGIGKVASGIDLLPFQALGTLVTGDPTYLAYSAPFTEQASRWSKVTTPAKTKWGQWLKNIGSGVGPKRLASIAPMISKYGTMVGAPIMAKDYYGFLAKQMGAQDPRADFIYPVLKERGMSDEAIDNFLSSPSRKTANMIDQFLFDHYTKGEGMEGFPEAPESKYRERYAQAGGGLTRTVAPDSGPVSRGLRSLYIDDMD